MDTDLRELSSHVHIDWNDPAKAHQQADTSLRTLAAKPELLLSRLNTLRAEDSGRQVETDEFRTKVVLLDALETHGSRLRMHFWNDDFADTPHQHRFAYCAQVLTGGYDHHIYGASGVDLEKPETVDVDELVDLNDPRLQFAQAYGNLRPSVIFQVTPGRTYFQGSDVDLSSTLIRGGTISLFLRGPAVRDVSFQLHRDRSCVVWRGGVGVSPAAHRDAVRGTKDDLDTVIQRYESFADAW